MAGECKEGLTESHINLEGFVPQKDVAEIGENKITIKKKGAKELRLLVMLLVFAAHPLAATTYTPQQGIKVNINITSQSEYWITVDALMGLDFTGLVLNTGQQQFNTPTLLAAQQNGQQVGGWQTVGLGNGTWGITNPYAVASQTGSLNTGLLIGEVPVLVTTTYWFSNQYGQVLNTDNWQVSLFAQTFSMSSQFGLTMTPEPSTLGMILAGIALLFIRAKRRQ